MWLAFRAGVFIFYIFLSADTEKTIKKIKKDQRTNNETREIVDNERRNS